MKKMKKSNDQSANAIIFDPSTVLTHVIKTNAAVLPSFNRLPKKWQLVIETL
ncbi:unnamed protein product, partial [Amoebophrya sp. A120]|eukprot:GSA120T00007038001.1